MTFANDAEFLAMRAANLTSTIMTLTANMSVQGLNLSASGQIELTTGEDPRFVNVNPQNSTQFPTWLSFDLRFFKVAVPPGQSKTIYGATIASSDDAPGFITTALGNFNKAAFDALPQDKSTTKLEFLQHDNTGASVFNFAVARVRLAGKNAGTAKQVRVFFRLFNAQTTSSAFDPSASYKTYSDGVVYGHRFRCLALKTVNTARYPVSRPSAKFWPIRRNR